MTKYLSQIDKNNVVINVIVVEESMTVIQAGVILGGTYVDIGLTGIGYQYDPITKKAIYVAPNIEIMSPPIETKEDKIQRIYTELKSVMES